MTQVAPEFSRPVATGTLPHGGRDIALTATEAECRALALRFDIPAIESLAASLHLAPLAQGRLRATGRLRARVVQLCVVSLEPFAQEVEAPVELIFVPRALLAEESDGGIDPDAPDEEPYDSDRVDLGEAVAQTLSLALDPWPRNPAAELPAGDGTGDGDDTPPVARSPFAVLARRRR